MDEMLATPKSLKHALKHNHLEIATIAQKSLAIMRIWPSIYLAARQRQYHTQPLQQSLNKYVIQSKMTNLSDNHHKNVKEGAFSNHAPKF